MTPPQLFSELLNTDLSYPLGCEVLGRVTGGRLAVRLLGLEDGHDVADLMVESGLGLRRDELLAVIQPLEQQASRPPGTRPSTSQPRG